MKHSVVLLLVVALVFVGSVAFGSVNQFEIEAGLTVDALMLPADLTIESAGVDFAEDVAYAEVFANNLYTNTVVRDVIVVFPHYFLVMMARGQAATCTTMEVSDRLKFPLSGPP